MSDTQKELQVIEPVKKVIRRRPAVPEKIETVASTEETIDWKAKYEALNTKLSEIEKKIAQPHPKDPNLIDKEKMSRLVKGMFRYHDNRGGVLKWFDRLPWKGSRLMRFTARDNEIIELPFYVADRLMEKGKVPIYTSFRDADKRPRQRIKEYHRRYEFFPYDEELLSKQRNQSSRVALVETVR